MLTYDCICTKVGSMFCEAGISESELLASFLSLPLFISENLLLPEITDLNNGHGYYLLSILQTVINI